MEVRAKPIVRPPVHGKSKPSVQHTVKYNTANVVVGPHGVVINMSDDDVNSDLAKITTISPLHQEEFKP